MRRAILFVEERLIHAVRVALHGERTIFQMREQDRRDPDVVIDELSLGEPGLRVQHLVQIRDRQFAALDDQLGFIAHAFANLSSARHLRAFDFLERRSTTADALCGCDAYPHGGHDRRYRADTESNRRARC